MTEAAPANTASDQQIDPTLLLESSTQGQAGPSHSGITSSGKGAKRKARTSGDGLDSVSPTRTTRVTRRSIAGGGGAGANPGATGIGIGIGVGAGVGGRRTSRSGPNDAAAIAGASVSHPTSTAQSGEPSRGEEENLNGYDFKGKGVSIE